MLAQNMYCIGIIMFINFLPSFHIIRGYEKNKMNFQNTHKIQPQQKHNAKDEKNRKIEKYTSIRQNPKRKTRAIRKTFAKENIL